MRSLLWCSLWATALVLELVVSAQWWSKWCDLGLAALLALHQLVEPCGGMDTTATAVLLPLKPWCGQRSSATMPANAATDAAATAAAYRMEEATPQEAAPEAKTAHEVEMEAAIAAAVAKAEQEAALAASGAKQEEVGTWEERQDNTGRT